VKLEFKVTSPQGKREGEREGGRERERERERDARNADHSSVAGQGFPATVGSGLSVFRKFG